MENQKNDKNMDRRSFLRSDAMVGAGLAVSPLAFGQRVSGGTDDINVAILGAGAQGHVLMKACFNIPDIRFKAVCDIWTNYNQLRATRTLQLSGHENNVYTDYREMLAEEKDLDAVIIATPDFWHSRHTIACLEAGLHVYCEKTMSNTIEGAKAMVEATRQSNKLLQIGHQRRSNPRYIHCDERLIGEAKLLGRITNAYGQWNRSKAACEFLPAPTNYEIDQATLAKYEYDSMEQFRNWRWFKGKGNGPVVDLGAHQIDIFNWFLGTKPKSLIASGGNNYWKDRQWPDNVVAVYEYQTEQGPVRALYQVISSNDSDGYYEKFMGDEGTLIISESSGRNMILKQASVESSKWEQWIEKDYIQPTKGKWYDSSGKLIPDDVLRLAWDVVPANYEFPDMVTLGGKPFHQPHLENFFNAIRGTESLNCPAEVAYETTVTVLKINEAIAAEKKLEFQPDEFSV